jgi:hypothetical protein
VSKNRSRASKNKFFNGENNSKNIFILFFYPKTCYSREELAGSALANARGRPGNTPVLAKTTRIRLRRSQVASGRVKK